MFLEIDEYISMATKIFGMWSWQYLTIIGPGWGKYSVIYISRRVDQLFAKAEGWGK